MRTCEDCPADITAHGNTRRCAVCARKRHLDQMRAAAARRYSALHPRSKVARAPKGNPRHAPLPAPPMLEPRFDGTGQFIGFSIWNGGVGLTDLGATSATPAHDMRQFGKRRKHPPHE